MGRDHSIGCEKCGASYGGFAGPDECPCADRSSLTRQIEAVTKERDEAKRELAEILDTLIVGPLEAGTMQDTIIALRKGLDAALAEVERMRGVYEAAIAIRTTPKCMCSPEQRDESCPAAQLEARLNVAIDHAITTAAAPCSICGTTKQPPCRHTAAAGKDSK